MITLEELRQRAHGLVSDANNLTLDAQALRDLLTNYTPEPPPPAPSFSPVSYSRFLYVVDNVNSIDTQVSRWPVQVLQGDEWHIPQLNALKAREGTLTLRYADPVVRRDSDHNGWTQCLPPGQIKDTWMLRDRQGAIIWRVRDNDQFVDPGNVEYQAAASKFLVDVCLREGWDGVWLDEINAQPTWSFGAWPAKYPTAYRYAVDGVRPFVLAISKALRAAGKKVYVNVAGSSFTDTWTVSLADPANVDGHCIEFFIARGDNPVATLENDAWKRTLDWVARCEKLGQFGMYHAMTTDPKLAVYALGTYLLATEGHGVFMASQDPYGMNDVWTPEFDKARKLGRPVGAYVVSGANFYQRQFEHGQVLVDPKTGFTSASIVVR